MHLVTLRPKAEIDLQQARDWYDRQRSGLGDEFLDAFKDLCRQIATNPEMFAVVSPGVRRVKLRTFPYVVYYRVVSTRIEVVGILHGSRDPRIWKRRI